MKSLMRCDKGGCKNSAILYQKYSGLHFCSKHFTEDVEKKVKREIRKALMIEKNDKVAVTLSGGKDSSVLLYILKKIFFQRPDLQFFAIVVDEGIKNYRSRTIKNAEKITKELGIKLLYFSFKEEFDFTVDEIASMKFPQGACSFCGVLRRKIINRKAKLFGATKVATGHNLDDEAQTILMNYIRGDMERLRRLGLQTQTQKEFVKRIKPLRGIPEKEIALYGIENEIIPEDFAQYSCPYAKFSFRYNIKKMVNELEEKYPGIKYSLMRGYEKLKKTFSNLPNTNTPIPLSNCGICGEASVASSNSKICKACEMIELINNERKREQY